MKSKYYTCCPVGLYNIKYYENGHATGNWDTKNNKYKSQNNANTRDSYYLMQL